MFCRGWHVMARVRARCSSKERLPAFCSRLNPTCSWGNEMVGCGCKTAAWTSTANTRQNAGCEGCSCQSLPPRTSDRPSLGNHHQGSLGAVNVAPLRGFGAKPQPSSVTLPVRQDIITLRNLSGRAGETWRAFDFICPRYSGLCCNNTPSHGFGSSTGRLQTDRFLLLQRLLGTRSHPTTSWALRPLLGRAGLRLPAGQRRRGTLAWRTEGCVKQAEAAATWSRRPCMYGTPLP
jgi:hypothetical protein